MKERQDPPLPLADLMLYLIVRYLVPRPFFEPCPKHFTVRALCYGIGVRLPGSGGCIPELSPKHSSDLGGRVSGVTGLF